MRSKLSLDHVLSFCGEKIPGRGEDSYCRAFCDTAGLLGVFDGCGGSGARTHEVYSGHTEAYVASRLCAGVFYDVFCKLFPCTQSAKALTEEVFAPAIKRCLHRFSPPEDESGIRVGGALLRTLPSTAAVALVQEQEDGSALVSAIWAGDSRVYIMDSNGLAQLTLDDSGVTDPMINIYEDGVLTNLLCSGKPVQLHCATFCMKDPFLVFTATDGCYGYLSTPMEFEGLILETLLKAESTAAWERELESRLCAVAGDDHTLCLAAYGYGSFEALQTRFAKRYKEIEERYLIPVSRLPIEDRESRYAIWAQYRGDYMRYIIEGGWA